ncbi:MAG TPA: trypsin-like peptidase domain-containing protein, partial [Solirubrobacterales bacterium]|nr:trypsin-like peptidase domain-containing protein [Solirubrobacterales bacterium]
LSAGESVGRVLRTACGLGIEGSGWSVAPGLIVTNAHVIAGADDTTVTTQDGVELDAEPVYYSPADDLALLRVGAEIPVLEISHRSEEGRRAAVLGYPENGPYALTPARVGETRETISEDSYGRGPVERDIIALGGRVRSGNSGGPVVDARGEVIGTVFAATTSGLPGGFAIPAGLAGNALEMANESTDTGPCTL